MKHLTPVFDGEQLEYEENVKSELITLLDISNGDAQGIMEVADMDMRELFLKGFTPLQTAELIERKTRVK